MVATMRHFSPPPVELVTYDQESSLPPGSGFLLASLASALFWLFGAAIFWIA